MSLPQSQTPAELSTLQRWFQSVVTHADGVETGAASVEAQHLIKLSPNELEKVITRSRALTAAERLAIYANAYHSRLMECLGEIFPMLKRTLGEDGFDALAFGYLQEYPSKSYTLNELGRHFAGYLEQTRPVQGETDANFDETFTSGAGRPINGNWADFLIDLARLEWAIYEVFDGPGVEGHALLDADQLLAIPTDRWPQAKLTPVVCLTLLSTRFPVNDYFTSLRKIAAHEALAMPAAADSFVALTRRDFVVRRYNLSQLQFELLKALKAGLSISEAVEASVPLASANIELDKLAADLQLWFRNWTIEGFFKSVT
jgi:hypothetical protein